LDILHKIVDVSNDFFWSYVLVYLLVGLGIYFTIRTRFVQFSQFGEMFRVIFERDKVSKKDKKGISSLQAFFISTASRVGTGNIAGVAIAISLGGPGAVFWMWLIAFVGMATSFIESTLAQVYKIQDGDEFRGGPAYYMEKALGQRWMGVLFAILVTLSFGLIFNSVQANTITLAFEESFNISKSILGIILAIFTAIIIFGGLKRVAKVTQVLVPIMATIYLMIAIIVCLINIKEIPALFLLIIKSAFGFEQVVGGGIGVVILNGIKRGLFSNEAGMGSAPNAAATAHVSHPAKQGFIQTLGVFFDTIVICSATAFIVLLYEVAPRSDLEGIQLTQVALANHTGDWAQIFIAIAILLLAFSSIIGNYYYGETNIEFIQTNKTWLLIYRLAVVAMVIFGSVAQFELVWDMADLFMGLMAILNLIAITLLAKVAIDVLKDYVRQRKEGKQPAFKANHIKGLKHAECWEDVEQSSKASK